MVQQQRDALARVTNKALQAFEDFPLPPLFSRQADVSLNIQPGFDNWDTLHIWFDPEQRNAMVKHLFWGRPFDIQRFTDPLMGVKYGWKETPNLIVRDHVPPYKDLQNYVSAILGAVPVESTSVPRMIRDGESISLILRLPLGELSLSWDNHRGVWGVLSDRCREIRDWVLNTPVLKS